MARLLNSLYVLMLFLALAACGGDGGAVNVDALQAHKLITERGGTDGFVLLDVRSAGEFAAGRLAGAVNINYHSSEFRSRIKALDRDATYLVYCHSGGRSSSALSFMRDQGFSDIVHMPGGIAEWAGRGLPVTRGP